MPGPLEPKRLAVTLVRQHIEIGEQGRFPLIPMSEVAELNYPELIRSATGTAAKRLVPVTADNLPPPDRLVSLATYQDRAWHMVSPHLGLITVLGLGMIAGETVGGEFLEAIQASMPDLGERAQEIERLMTECAKSNLFLVMAHASLGNTRFMAHHLQLVHGQLKAPLVGENLDDPGTWLVLAKPDCE
ncbi:MAG: hypothetical protein PHT12_05465 [Patescibacteria group bacterium]|nr:hypothetical protein [Patescibacteria group bacterium]